jgi:hypothetical protein
VIGFKMPNRARRLIQKFWYLFCGSGRLEAIEAVLLSQNTTSSRLALV